jgi:peptidoglycan hydrolase-like protein with peptidoglycan-binding domain
MHGIFINYRRDDAAGFARSLYEHLAREFREGQVFMDVEALREPGIDFVKEIERSLGRCAVMLVLIGKEWLDSATPDGRRRLDEPDDFVRLEIATALKREVRVIPVLLNGATMPSVDALPADLQLMGRRQAIAITHDDWMHDVSRLADSLARVPGIRKRSAKRSGWSTRSMMIAGTGGGAIAVGLLVWLGFVVERGGGASPPSNETSYYTAPDDATTKTDTWTSTPDPADNAPPADGSTRTAPPLAASDDVHRAQVLLASLGYDPGVVDGLQGGATTTAVQAFQRDEGYAVTGVVDGSLLAQLQATYDERSSSASAQVSEQPAAYESKTSDFDEGYDDGGYAAYDGAGAGANVSGTWYDDNGIPAQIVQVGDALTVGAVNPATGMLQIIGNGVVQGGVVTIQYQNFAGVPGVVEAQLAPDGRHMNGTDTNSLLNIPVPNTWHLEHLPGS